MTKASVWLIEREGNSIQISDDQQRIRYRGSAVGIAERFARNMATMEQWLPQLEQAIQVMQQQKTGEMDARAKLFLDLYLDLKTMAELT